jgi:hypothetical protein
MKFRIVFWDVLGPTFQRYVLPPSSSLMMEAVRTSETSVDNYFTRQYIPEDNSENSQMFKMYTTNSNIVDNDVHQIGRRSVLLLMNSGTRRTS